MYKQGTLSESRVEEAEGITGVFLAEYDHWMDKYIVLQAET